MVCEETGEVACSAHCCPGEGFAAEHGDTAVSEEQSTRTVHVYICCDFSECSGAVSLSVKSHIHVHIIIQYRSDAGYVIYKHLHGEANTLVH